MKTLGIGSSLWLEWEGEGYDPAVPGTTFYTIGHVDIWNETVKMALARALQQFGFVDSLGDGLKAVDGAYSYQGWVGHVDESTEWTQVTREGETFGGDEAEDVIEATWVTVNDA